MCKRCAAQLSPWFDDRRHSTVEEIKNQLEYREANKQKVATFRVTRSFGNNTKVLLDEDAGLFMVATERDYAEENPDVLKFTDVTNCIIDVDEFNREITYLNGEGEQERYNPPRYEYNYDFFVEIHVSNPYFDEIRFKLNNSSVSIERRDNRALSEFLLGAPGGFDPSYNDEYRFYKTMAEEIKEALLQAQGQAREEERAAAAPKTATTCPYCGATTTPNAAGCCEFCGGAINGQKEEL